MVMSDSGYMDNIFALSSGALPSGVAVIRISGWNSRIALETIAGDVPPPRKAVLRTLSDPVEGAGIDKGIVLWFPGPDSFTGEDCAEFQVHGGPAVVSALCRALRQIEGFRMAEAGEFTRRAFANGRIDLTEAEGLADLISAQTGAQREMAFRQNSGGLRNVMEGWSRRLTRLRAHIEADLDFSDEEDVPGGIGESVWKSAEVLGGEIAAFLDDGHRGEIIRDGFQVVLLGRPNSGKSSLLNALARRSVAIVSAEAGTTRDILEVNLDLAGYAVTIVDTAGIRESGSEVESEGIRRALDRAERADLIIWLSSVDEPEEVPEMRSNCQVMVFRSKDDVGVYGKNGISVVRANGTRAIIDSVTELVQKRLGGYESVSVTRERHRQLLTACADAIRQATEDKTIPLEIRAEYLREAAMALGRITGAVDVEDLLDVIFSEFCIGK
jgi:tRNA modification GTPase